MDHKLDFAIHGARAEIHRMHADALDNITGTATLAERDTWPAKEAAAHALVAGTASKSDLAMLGTEAAMGGTDAGTLAATVIARAAEFKLAVGFLAGTRAQAFAAFSAATTVSEVDAALATASETIESLNEGKRQ